jgi:hypothetical protein
MSARSTEDEVYARMKQRALAMARGEIPHPKIPQRCIKCGEPTGSLCVHYNHICSIVKR